MTIHAKVYALAEKYDIQCLKNKALEKFRKEVDACWMSADFLRAAEEVYTSTMDHDRSMRDVVVETFTQHPNLLDREETQNMVRGLDLCYDLMMQFRAGFTPLDRTFGSRRWK